MARPRTFDADAALDAALRVFWMRGYRGASLEELTNVSGGSRPSLYAAFDDKNGLFAAALHRYRERFDAEALAVLESEADGRIAIERFLRLSARRFTDPDLPPGCPIAMQCAAMEPEPATDADENAQSVAAELDAALHAKLRARLARAKADEQLPPGEPLGPLADYLHGVRHALSVAARLGRSERALRAMIDVAMRTWPDERASVA
ncbi:TetR/AcrR family transcriptional regulator [Alienimonas chondri]|uniref:HTH-type transcriptional repressor ComR n=1 Tax=Alienimonas chondri TaxID=2681879 RepID=A0ABX1VAU1_9PLAN|nr:TetR/AcrR family transcriptional regulator [Alienimonas chondri]NNJ25225.1 HTH-type transcriptional repressor ComR [Alienimonas chondri]